MSTAQPTEDVDLTTIEHLNPDVACEVPSHAAGVEGCVTEQPATWITYSPHGIYIDGVHDHNPHHAMICDGQAQTIIRDANMSMICPACGHRGRFSYFVQIIGRIDGK